MVKPQFRGKFMAQQPTQFSELSQQYGLIQNNRQQVAAIESQLTGYLARLTELKTQKTNLTNLQQLQAQNAQLFTSDAQSAIAKQLQQIDAEINSITGSVQNLRDNDLYKQKDAIESASKDLDSYIESANTNYAFRRAVGEELVRRTQTRIDELTAEQSKPNEYVAFIEKLQSIAQNDPSLKSILSSIDKNKADINSLNITKTSLDNLVNQSSDPRVKNSMKASYITINKGIADKTTDLNSKSDDLKKYISDHREDFGLPAGTDDLNFDDATSPLSIVSVYTDPNENKGLDDLKAEYANIVNISSDRIEELNKLNRFLDYAEHDLDTVREEELENMYTPFFTKVKVFFINLKNRFVSWAKDKEAPKPIKAPPRGAEVVGSHSDFINSIHTEIGQDAIAKVAQKYEQKYAQEKAQQQQQTSHNTPDNGQER